MNETEPAGPGVLIGRDRELRQMLALLGAVTAGRPVAVVVEGPPASGRGRLLEELGRAARRLGLTVLPQTEWARAVAWDGDGDGRELERERPPVLLLGSHPGRIDARVWAMVERFADYVPVLIAVPARTGTDPLPVDGRPQVHRLRLPALPPREVAQLATALLGGQPGPDLLELCRVAAGRPGVIRELVVGLREEGLVQVVGGRAVLSTVRLPGRTRDRLLNQLAELSPQARRLVQAATTVRSPFALVRLTRLLRTSPLVLIPAIDEVLESGLLTGDNEMLRFGHDLVRAVVESSIPPSVVAALRSGQPRNGPPPGPDQRRAAPGRSPESRAADWSLLTAREREIAELAGQALTNQQIANRLGRTTHTVNYHLRQIFQKLGLTSRVELAAQLRRQRPTTKSQASPHCTEQYQSQQYQSHQIQQHQIQQHQGPPGHAHRVTRVPVDEPPA
jgi:DNA-binding NarL/FixJ family response regulator